MAEINLKTLTPDTSLPKDGFIFGADSQASTNPSVYSTQTVATTLLGSTSLTGDTLTASAPVLNLTQTWNSVGTTFTGMKFNVASDTSAAASLLMDLQVGGTSQFKVSKSGTVTIATNCALGGADYYYAGGGTSGGGFGSRGSQVATILAGAIQIGEFRSPSFGTTGVGFIVRNDAYVGFLPSTGFGDNPDLLLTRKAAANFRFGAADAASPVAQTLSVQSIVGGLTGTPNLSAAAYPFTITGAQGTGTGAGGSIVFKVAPAAGSSSDAQNGLVGVWQITGAGNLTCPTDNTYDIGGSGVNRPRRLYMSSEVNTPFLNFTSAIQHSNGTFMTSPGNGFFKIMSSDQATKGVLITAPSTVANLPSAVTGGAGGRTFVTDATMTMALGIGTAVVGGGANKVPVYSDGANWFIG